MHRIVPNVFLFLLAQIWSELVKYLSRYLLLSICSIRHCCCYYTIILSYIMLFSSKAGLLPTPNSTKIHSKNPNDYIKTSNYPIPFQAVNIVESFNINCQPTWDISVASKLVKFRAEKGISLAKFIRTVRRAMCSLKQW